MGQHRCAFIVQFERKECQDSNSSKSSGEIHILSGCCYAEGVREWRNSHFKRVLLRRRRSRVEKFIKCGCCYAEGVRESRNSHFMRVLLRRRRSRVEKFTFYAGVVTPKAFASFSPRLFQPWVRITNRREL